MSFSQTLLAWYDQNKRILPWRNTKDPYTIWVSEIILQQTRVDQGMKYFFSFMDAFPDVQALAQAPLQQLLHVWQGLGYYSRARNMHLAARGIVFNNNNQMPVTYHEWLQLKGVGPYTAAAIASIVSGQVVAALDGNGYRVLGRIFAVQHGFESAAEKKAFFKLACSLIDHSRPGDFNQALMDFGSMICKPAAPRCDACPFNPGCLALKSDQVLQYPIRRKKSPPRVRHFNYYLILDPLDHTFWVQKRQGNDIWKDLYELPLVETPEASTAGNLFMSLKGAPQQAENDTFRLQGHPHVLTHKLTHQTILASIFIVEVSSSKKLYFSEPFVRVSYDDFEKMPKSRLMQRFFNNSKVIRLLNHKV